MKRILFIFITSFIFFCPYVVDAASISFLGTTTVGEVGDNITVKVTVNEPTGLGSWEYKLNYDTSKLKLLSGNTHVVDYVNGEGETSKSYTYTFKVVRAGSTVISVADATVASWDEVITTPTASTVISLKGNYWSYENGYWYYYKDENKLQGFQEIDGKTYFFSYVNSALKYGLQVLDGKTFYLNEKGEVQYGWHNVDGFRYYFGSDGYAYQGFKDIEGKTYFFSYVNSTLKYGWQGIDGKLFYLNEAGEVQYGWHNIGNFRYYFGTDGYAYQGFQNIDNKTYFFSYVNSALKYGLQVLDGKSFYLNEKGEVQYGWHNIGNFRYYFGSDGYAYQGFKDIDDKTYFFSYVNSALKYGWQGIDGKLFYLNEAGEVQYGWHNIGNFRYYFGSDGYAYQGFQNIDNKTYFFSYVNSALKYGLQVLDGKSFYLNEKGEVQYGWYNVDGFRYYFGSDGYAYQGFKYIEGKTYFFSYVNSALKYGWQGIDGKLFYLTSEGVLFEGKGFQTIEGKSYYFEDNYAVRGYKEIEGNTYYFDSVTGEFRTGLHLINGNEYYYNEYGILTKIQYNPVYYSQKDERWSGIVFGLGDMKNTGCLPTALAMAFQSILGYTITPFNVANYLYNNTIEYNKLSTGASGLAIQYAATYYKVPWKGLANKQEVIQALSSGKVVIATVGPGKFTVAPYTHTIVIYKYSNGNTYALDPYNSNKNGWVSFDTVWNEQSTNSYDLRGDFAFYVLG